MRSKNKVTLAVELSIYKLAIKRNSRPKRALEQFYLESSEQRVRILLVYNYYDATHLLFKMFSIDSRHKIQKILKMLMFTFL